MDPLYDPLVKIISNLCWKIWKKTGPGFDEEFYKKALALEFTKSNIKYSKEKYVPVYYDGILLSRKFLDLVAEDRIIIEAKATKSFFSRDFSQLRSYLKSTDLPYGILVNFGTSPLDFRIVFKEYTPHKKEDDEIF